MEMLLLKKKEFVSVYQGCLELPQGEVYVIASLRNDNELIDISGHIIHPNGTLQLINEDDTIDLVIRALREYLSETTDTDIVLV